MRRGLKKGEFYIELLEGNILSEKLLFTCVRVLRVKVDVQE